MANILASMFLIMHIITYISCEIMYSYDPRSYEMPESCEGLRFCHDKGQFYPTEVVNEVLKDLKFQITDSAELDQRISIYDSPLDPECATEVMKFKPVYYVLDNNNQTRVVIQSAKHTFWQIFDLRSCKKVGRVFRTLHFRRLILSQVNMTCNNVMTTLDFYVLTSSKLDMELISVEMPVFCKAKYDQ